MPSPSSFWLSCCCPSIHPLLCGPSFQFQLAHFLTSTLVLCHSNYSHQASSLHSSFNLCTAQSLKGSFFLSVKFSPCFTLTLITLPFLNQPIGLDATQELPLSPALIAVLIVGSGWGLIVVCHRFWLSFLLILDCSSIPLYLDFG